MGDENYINEDMDQLVVLPIPDNVLFPGGTLELRLQGGQSDGIIDFFENETPYAACFTFKGKRENQDLDLESVGTLAKVEWERGEGDFWELTLTGMERIQSHGMIPETGRLICEFSYRAEINDLDFANTKALMESIRNLSKDIMDMIDVDSRVKKMVEELEDLGTLIDFCCQSLNISTREKQGLLEIASVQNRALKVIEYMMAQRESIELQIEMSNKVADSTNKINRESLLREQIRVIKDELGEGPGSMTEDYRKRILGAEMTPEAQIIALEELDRLEAQVPHSPETNGIRNYLDTLLALPWAEPPEQDIDIQKAREILEEDHYGLEDIKERILQDLAVLKIKKNKKGAMLLFVGPPGVGKTSLGQSIARALGREFTRASLGGVRDESEIKGHRRTYLGALPGRIIQNMKRLKTRNPVFLLDEIDKLSKGWSGDPSASLLDVLDPEQNSVFVDHFLDVPYDLSSIFFVATANTTDTIPGPLLDRMEVIRLSGYTEEEKRHIAQRHLIPKQLEDHGLEGQKISITEPILKQLISQYTKEAGVRSLQRRIASLCRIGALRISEYPKASLPLVFEEKDLEQHLGKEKSESQEVEDQVIPGVATGLAWTPYGGEILFIETAAVPGKGVLTLTGQLGEVMQESAKIAITLIRQNIPSVSKNFQFDTTDIHIHVPAGGTPKDGPSAGIALLAALTSLVTDKSIDQKTALTGEVTLRGAVMPVGGIKEKFLAAHRAGVRKIYMSSKNMKDLKDIPKEILDHLELVPLHRVEDLFSDLFNVKIKLPASFPWAPKPALS